jgi:transglutaminase-like putative cysteine protease
MRIQRDDGQRMLRLFVAGILLSSSISAVAATPARARGQEWKYHTHREQIDVRSDGSNVRHYEFVYTVLAEGALDSLNERTISYHDRGETLRDVVAYTLKKDGARIDVPDSNVQVTSHAGINGAAPAFSDFKDQRMIFPDLEVGDSVVLSYTIEQHKPTFKDRYSLLTYYSVDHAYDDAELVVSAPHNFGLKQKTYGLDAPKHDRLEGGREQWTWHYENAQPRDRSSDSDAVSRAWHYADLPTIEISNFASYAQIAAAYESEAAARAQPSERARKLAAEIVGDAKEPRVQAEKLYAWVAKNISFAGNCLNGGDVVPRDTDSVLNLRMGDCKDHATLLQALLAARGIKSTQVLVDSGRWFELPEVPCWQAFNHVINYVPELSVYLDATSTSSPFGVLPDAERGKPVIFTSTYGGIEHTPQRLAADNSSSAVDEVSVAADGSIEVKSHYQFGGMFADGLSEWFGKWKKSPEYDGGTQYFRHWIEQLGFHGSGGYDEIGDATGPAETFKLSMHYRIEGFLDTTNPYGFALTPPFPGPNAIAQLAGLAAVDSYAHDFLCHGDTRSEELAITLPDNVKLLAVPKDAHAQTPLVRFDASYAQQGNTIRVKRTVVDSTPGPICKADTIKQYAQIAAAVKKDARTQAVYAPK